MISIRWHMGAVLSIACLMSNVKADITENQLKIFQACQKEAWAKALTFDSIKERVLRGDKCLQAVEALPYLEVAPLIKADTFRLDGKPHFTILDLMFEKGHEAAAEELLTKAHVIYALQDNEDTELLPIIREKLILHGKIYLIEPVVNDAILSRQKYVAVRKAAQAASQQQEQEQHPVTESAQQ